MVHVVPPHGESLILFVDDPSSSNGVDLAWLRGSRLRRISLGLDAVPASTVTNIRFSPDGTRIAFLITLAHGALIAEGLDPLHRLRGWESQTEIFGETFDITCHPCEDCTVQIADLEADDLGFPHDLVLHTFTHVFVPEYGFDMVWRGTSDKPELAFAAMLHSSAGAATYLVRWKTFASPNESNFVFMAVIDGASIDLIHDKRHAMLSYKSTRCTSRIEIGEDAQIIFFDTTSKFGVLRFDQVDDAASSRVTRADLPNNPFINPRSSCAMGMEPQYSEQGDSSRGLHRVRTVQRTYREGCLSKQLHAGNSLTNRTSGRARARGDDMGSPDHDVARTSRMSPDGMLLCSVICNPNARIFKSGRRSPHRLIEMRSTLTGRLLYRHHIPRPRRTLRIPKHDSTPFEKSDYVARRTITFSNDSRLVLIWDTYFSSVVVSTSKRLPYVYEVETGRLVQDFCAIGSTIAYDQVQTAPDALTVYGTRVSRNRIVMDAIDVLSGLVLKTEPLTGDLMVPTCFAGHFVFTFPNQKLAIMSRGWLDTLWETTRGYLGCGWKSERRCVYTPAHSENPGDDGDQLARFTSHGIASNLNMTTSRTA